MKKIIASPELIGAMMGHLPAPGIVQLEKDPNNFMKAFGFGFGTTSDVKAVTNEADIVNIALPYYSGMERTAGAMLSDDDLEAVSGGAAIQVLDNYVLSGVRDILAEGPLTRERLDEALQEYSNATGGGSPFSW